MAAIAACIAMGAGAQDVATETPPELKDFRLDTPPARDPAPKPQTLPPPPTPEPSPAPQPKAEAPRGESPATRVEPKSAPRAAAPEASPAARPDAAEAPVAEPLSPENADAALPETTGEPADQPILENSPPAQRDWLAEATRFWPALLALFAALLGWLGYRAWRSRRRGGALADTDDDLLVEPLEPRDSLVPAKAAVPPTPFPTIGAMTASFEPADARLSIANLTITGCLRLRYDGTEPLASLRLRNQVISACEGQQAMINGFHADPTAGRIDALGAVQPGEEIVLTLELQVPREGLQAFDWRQRLFVAPILLLNIDSEDRSVAPCRINSLVGLEGDPTSPRMRPMPIDRGPRHFDALRFRPLAA